MKIKNIMLMSNGNIAVFDEMGQQIPELQGSVIVKVMEEAQKRKIELDDDMEILINGERWYKLKGYLNITSQKEKVRREKSK